MTIGCIRLSQIFGAVLVLAAVAVVRVAEYTAPASLWETLDSFESVVQALEDEARRAVPPDAENAAMLYHRAFEMLSVDAEAWPDLCTGRELKSGWVLTTESSVEEKPSAFRETPSTEIENRIRESSGEGTKRTFDLPLPPAQFSSTVREQINALRRANRSSLALLYQAATLPGAHWPLEDVWNTERPWHRESFWGSDPAMAGVMLFDGLGCVLDGDMDGFLRAMDGIMAYRSAQDTVFTLLMGVRGGRAVMTLFAFALQSGIMDDETLLRLDAVLAREPDAVASSLRYGRLQGRLIYDDIAPLLTRGWNRTRSGLGSGLAWHADRLRNLGLFALPLEATLVRDILFRALDEPEQVWARAEDDNYFRGWAFYRIQAEIADPYGRHEPFLLESFMSSLMTLHHELHSLHRFRSMRVALALERYRRDHGAFPDALEALLPGYADEKLVALFLEGGVARYTRTDQGWNLEDYEGLVTGYPRLYTYPSRTIHG